MAVGHNQPIIAIPKLVEEHPSRTSLFIHRVFTRGHRVSEMLDVRQGARVGTLPSEVGIVKHDGAGDGVLILAGT